MVQSCHLSCPLFFSREKEFYYFENWEAYNNYGDRTTLKTSISTFNTPLESNDQVKQVHYVKWGAIFFLHLYIVPDSSAALTWCVRANCSWTLFPEHYINDPHHVPRYVSSTSSESKALIEDTLLRQSAQFHRSESSSVDILQGAFSVAISFAPT